MKKITNDYGVSKKEWAKWDATERATFNFLFFMMTDNRAIILSEEEKKSINEIQWKVIAWNSAFIGAINLRHERVVRAREAR